MKISENQRYIDTTGRTILIHGRKKVNNDKLWVYYGYQVDRSGKQISDLGMWKSDGRDWAGDIRCNLLREASSGMKLDEASSVILERLIEAVETDRAMPGSTGPKQFGNGMPATGFDDIDIWIIEAEEAWRGQADHTRRRTQSMLEVAAKRSKCTPQRISRMEQAFSWLGAYIIDHEMRKILIAYATCKANGWDWGGYIERHNRNNRKENVWVKRTIYRRIEKILQHLVIKLRSSDILLRDCAGCVAAQDEAQTHHKQITSDLCLRSQGDLNRDKDPMLATADAA